MLYALYEHKIIIKDKNNTEEYNDEIQKLLKEIKKDIDGYIKK